MKIRLNNTNNVAKCWKIQCNKLMSWCPLLQCYCHCVLTPQMKSERDLGELFWSKDLLVESMCIVYRKPGAIYSNKERRPKSRGKYRCKKKHSSSLLCKFNSFLLCPVFSTRSCLVREWPFPSF